MTTALEVLDEALRGKLREKSEVPMVRGLTVTHIVAASGRRIAVTLAIETEPGLAHDLIDDVADALGAPAHSRYGGGRSTR